MGTCRQSLVWTADTISICAAFCCPVYAGLRVLQIDFDAFRSRTTALNFFQCNPVAACVATFFKAGAVALSPCDLSGAHKALQRSVEDLDIISAAGVCAFQEMIHAISSSVQGSDAAGDAAVEAMRSLLMSCAEDAEECWRSRAMMWVGAVCALGGPVCGLHAMEGVLEQVDEALEQHIDDMDVLELLNQVQLQECYSALQGVGQALVPSLTAVA